MEVLVNVGIETQSDIAEPVRILNREGGRTIGLQRRDVVGPVCPVPGIFGLQHVAVPGSDIVTHLDRVGELPTLGGEDGMLGRQDSIEP